MSGLSAVLACPDPWPDVTRPVLTARGLELHSGERVLCRGLDLDVRAGECVAILGRNGAGKTTLLCALAGLTKAVGEVRLTDRPIAQIPLMEAARLRGLLPQSQSIPFSASVLETVLIGRHPHLGRWGWEADIDFRIARAALDVVGLAGFEARNLLALSGGEKQRVALATLLAQTPRVFLLDEPLNHLDLHHQIVALEALRALTQEGRSVVMVMHDLGLAAKYADSVVLFDGEEGVLVGPLDEVLTSEQTSRAFEHPLKRIEVEGQVVFLQESGRLPGLG